MAKAPVSGAGAAAGRGSRALIAALWLVAAGFAFISAFHQFEVKQWGVVSIPEDCVPTDRVCGIPVAGFPLIFMVNRGGTSSLTRIGMEDYFQPARFLANVLIYLIPARLALGVWLQGMSAGEALWRKALRLAVAWAFAVAVAKSALYIQFGVNLLTWATAGLAAAGSVEWVLNAARPAPRPKYGIAIFSAWMLGFFLFIYLFSP